MAGLEESLRATLGGKAAAKLDAAFGLTTTGDLLRHYPRRYATRGELTDLASLRDGDHVTVFAQVEKVKTRPMRARRGQLLEVTVTDGRARLALTFFNRVGFWGQITITFPGAVPARWQLRIGYPAGHILGMNPDSHLAPNGHAAVVRSTDYARGSGADGRTFAVGVGVQGAPAHPARCSFNGRACHFG